VGGQEGKLHEKVHIFDNVSNFMVRSGKSSLTLCLLRMLNLDSGSITIDNINLTQLSHDFVSSKLIALPQEVYILEGSVRLNIDPTKEIPDANIVLVLEKVQLWEKINARGGLDAIVDDKFFSTGEAQLLVFARAMLRKSKVLILDEFTSR
jgi:ABC-type multidrug transport system fused ATPase/permease subunit